jgi:carbon storage regulator
VLSRKEGESLVLSNGVEIVVAEIRGDKTKLAIKAPADVFVYRSEFLERNPGIFGRPLVKEEDRDDHTGVA